MYFAIDQQPYTHGYNRHFNRSQGQKEPTMTTNKPATSIELGKCLECKKDYTRSELGTCTTCNGFLCYKCSCDCDPIIA